MINAFLMGLFSAASLPLGTLTTLAWKPGNRTIAFLMAFGSGALLAALTIDLVGSALDKGHFNILAVGCILGSLVYIILNQIVNHRGGFLRKASTTILHMSHLREGRLRGILRNLQRVDVFRDLPKDDLQTLVRAMILREYEPKTTLYCRGDPAEFLFVIDDGDVTLKDPGSDMAAFRHLHERDAFGRMAFLTHAPHATVAVTQTPARCWLLPRQALLDMLPHSPELRRGLQSFLRTPKVHTYLMERHAMDQNQADAWIDQAVTALEEGHDYLPAVQLERRSEAFMDILPNIQRAPFFQNLDAEEARCLAETVVCMQRKKGHIFFMSGEQADRMYIIEQGEVALLDPHNPSKTLTLLSAQHAFGMLSFLTSSCHSVTVVVSEDMHGWMIRRHAMDRLLKRCPSLEKKVEEYLSREIPAYLENQHGFDVEKAVDYTRHAIRSVEAGQIMPSRAVHQHVTEQESAPMAIWLGILLDGIPESLVIGSSMLHGHISYSLLAGLFLSNYPEALSSSAVMLQQGWSFRRVFLMWFSLMVLTGIGAALGHLFFEGASPLLYSLVEGVAAGSMLTMIAETMLPEAYYKGGNIIGFSTLLGFLTAIFCTTLEDEKPKARHGGLNSMESTELGESITSDR